uniref:Endoglucanase n=1 Tax=Daucus carota subsp. sativus TaxID=79200 RepID=A0A166CQ50_DAUCS
MILNLNYLGNNGDALGRTGWAMTEFGWDVKYAGVQTLVAKGSRNVQKTPGGLIFKQRWNNLQFVTSASFLMTVYSDYLTSARKTLRCPSGNVQPSQLLSFAKSQVDYILGDNPRATSYMVGYGNNYPQQVHHRGSSIVSIKGSRNVQKTPGGLIFKQRWNNLQFVTSASFLMTVYSDYLTSARKTLRCPSGNVQPSQLLSFAKSQVDYILGDNPRATSYMEAMPHGSVGRQAIPISWLVPLLEDLMPYGYDNFADERDNYEQTEPAKYNNAPLFGLLVMLHAGHSGYNQLLPVNLPKPFAVRLKPAPRPRVSPAPEFLSQSYTVLSGVLLSRATPMVLPAWNKSLGPGKSIEFVYIHSASAASVSVTSYTLA